MDDEDDGREAIADKVDEDEEEAEDMRGGVVGFWNAVVLLLFPLLLLLWLLLLSDWMSFEGPLDLSPLVSNFQWWTNASTDGAGAELRRLRL